MFWVHWFGCDCVHDFFFVWTCVWVGLSLQMLFHSFTFFANSYFSFRVSVCVFLFVLFAVIIDYFRFFLSSVSPQELYVLFMLFHCRYSRIFTCFCMCLFMYCMCVSVIPLVFFYFLYYKLLISLWFVTYTLTIFFSCVLFSFFYFQFNFIYYFECFFSVLL